MKLQTQAESCPQFEQQNEKKNTQIYRPTSNVTGNCLHDKPEISKPFTMAPCQFSRSKSPEISISKNQSLFFSL